VRSAKQVSLKINFKTTKKEVLKLGLGSPKIWPTVAKRRRRKRRKKNYRFFFFQRKKFIVIAAVLCMDESFKCMRKSVSSAKRAAHQNADFGKRAQFFVDQDKPG
jgi:hypothetical protein